MKKFLLLFALMALFTTNASAKDGDIFEDHVSHIDANGKKTQLTMRFQVSNEKDKQVCIYGYKDNGEQIHSSIVSDYDNKPGEIIIPETVNGYTVAIAGEYAFYNCVAKVTLPKTIWKIGANAFFQYLYNGYDFALPSKVRIIGQYAFWGAKIKGISLNTHLQIIEDYAFASSDIESLIIPKGIVIIGVGITAGCDNMKSLAVESGNELFYTPEGSNVIMCNEERVLTYEDWELISSKSPKYPGEDVTVILYYVWNTLWAGCPNSRIPEDAERINQHAFQSIQFTNQNLIIPKNVCYIGEAAFESSNIKHLVLRCNTMKLDEYAFCGCPQMERLDIYGGNVTIAKRAFKDCTALTEMWCYDHKPKILASEEQFENIGPNWSAFHGQTKIISVEYTDEFTDEFDGENVWKRWFYSKIYGLDDNTKEIGSIYLDDYTWPLAGEDADFTATSLTEHATVSKVEYRYGTKIINPSPYSVGDTLDIAFTITLDEGYTFADDATLSVCGHQNDIVVNRSSTERAFIIQKCAVPTPPGGMPIKSVSIGIEEPVEGQPLSTTVTSPTGRFYERVSWVIDSVKWDGSNLNSYNPDETYTLTAYVHAKTDYTFSPDIDAKLNGRTAGVTHGMNSEGIPTLEFSIHYGLQAYTVFDEDNNTLTYYYDGQMDSRPGVKEVYDYDNNPGAVRFKDYKDKVVRAVIDPSMKNAPMTSMYRMFIALDAMMEIEGLENLNTEDVRNTNYMFGGCKSLKSIDLSSFNTDKLESPQFMFYNCKSLTSLDLTNFNTNKVYSTKMMFYGCSSLTTIYCNDDWSALKLLGSTSMFEGCTALVGGKGTKYDESVIDITYARPDGGIEAPGYFTTKAIKGDVDGNGFVNSADVVAIYNFILSGEEKTGITKAAADVDGNGEVNSADIVSVYNIIIGN